MDQRLLGKTEKKPLPAGIQDFQEMVQNGCYYVDKTRFIKSVMMENSSVLLITRPRRFGKTLFMDTMARFLRNKEGRGHQAAAPESLFEWLEITKDRDFCNAYMGQFPVVFLSMKSIYGEDYREAYEKFASLVVATCVQHGYLLNSSKLSALDKQNLTRCLDFDYLADPEHKTTAQKFLQILVSCLCRHHDRKVVLLIDEYDVPLAKATAAGYYDKMIGLVRPLLEDALKPDPSTDAVYLRKAVLTGCLRVSKESIFTGLNNPGINTVCSEDVVLSEAIGFSPDEVTGMLDYYGLSNRLEDVKHWYDGYRFAGRDIFCPWDVIKFCQSALCSQNPQTYRPENYWDGTGSSDTIREFLGFLAEEDADRMQSLVDGGSVDLTINDKLTYSDFALHRSSDFWTLLLFTGYLTVVERLIEPNEYRVRIPNDEIRDTFIRNVKERFSKEDARFSQHGKQLVEAALAGDADGMAEVLVPLLKGYVSVRDAATRAPAESYYHGFLTALFASSGLPMGDFVSNGEAGDGFADIVFFSGVGTRRIGVVIEIKRCSKKDDLYDAADMALKQICDKHYTERLDKFRCGKTCLYGIAFCRKDCVVTGGAAAKS